MNNLTEKINVCNLKIKELTEQFNKLLKELNTKTNDTEIKYQEINKWINNQINIFIEGLNNNKRFGFFNLPWNKFSQFKSADQNYDLKEEILNVITRIKVDVENLYTEVYLMLDELYEPAINLHYQAEDLEEEKDEITDNIFDAQNLERVLQTKLRQS